MLASVAGVSITAAEVDHWATIRKQLDGAASADRHATVSALIALRTIVGEAAEYGVHVTQGEAHKDLELLSYRAGGSEGLGLAPAEAELRRLLALSSLSTADRIWLVKVQALASRLSQRLSAIARAAVPRQAVADFYRRHEHAFLAPERRDIEIFLTNTLADARLGRDEIEAGRTFKSVAMRRNVSPEGGREGLVMGLARGAGEPVFEKYVFHAKPHVLVGPIKQVLFYVFRVSKAEPPSLRPLTAVEGAIRRQLAGDAALNALRMGIRRRWVAKTHCFDGRVQGGCVAATPAD